MIEYRTSDLWFAAFLRCEGGVVQSIEKGKKNGRMVFRITLAADTLSDAMSTFYQGQARVDPLKFKHSITDLRSALSTRAMSLPTKDIKNGTPSTEAN